MPDKTALSMVEPQPKSGPALSATSDMPATKAEAPKISEERVPTDQKAKDDDAAAAAAADAAKAADEKAAADKANAEDPAAKAAADAAAAAEAEKKRLEAEDPLNSDKTPEWLKELAAKERNKARGEASARKAAETRALEAERKASEASANLTKALEGLETLTKAQAAQISKEAEKEDPRPAREAFDTPESYETALIDWSGRRAALVAKAEAQKEIEDKLTAEKTEAEHKRVKEQNDVVLAEFAKRKAKFIEDHPDYEELVESEEPDKVVQISIPMANAILTDEDGPAIAYYLGQNRDEAERISKLAPVQAVAALGRIAARLAAKPAPATKPAPLATLKTGAETAVRKTANEESMEEYGARRQREIANDKRQRMGLAPLN